MQLLKTGRNRKALRVGLLNINLIVKKLIYPLLLSVILFGFASCKKTEDPIAAMHKCLTNSSKRTWKLTGIKIDGNQQTLTAAEAGYNKTYNANGTWRDSDGYTGTFTFLNVNTLQEVTTNSNPKDATISYFIFSINNSGINVSYMVNNQTYQFLYVQ